MRRLKLYTQYEWIHWKFIISNVSSFLYALRYFKQDKLCSHARAPVRLQGSLENKNNNKSFDTDMDADSRTHVQLDVHKDIRVDLNRHGKILKFMSRGSSQLCVRRKYHSCFTFLLKMGKEWLFC